MSSINNSSLSLTLLHSEWPKLYGVLAVLSAIGLKAFFSGALNCFCLYILGYVGTLQAASSSFGFLLSRGQLLVGCPTLVWKDYIV